LEAKYLFGIHKSYSWSAINSSKAIWIQESETGFFGYQHMTPFEFQPKFYTKQHQTLTINRMFDNCDTNPCFDYHQIGHQKCTSNDKQEPDKDHHIYTWSWEPDEDHHIYMWSWEPDILVLFMFFNIYFSVCCFVRILMSFYSLTFGYCIACHSMYTSDGLFDDNRNRDWYHSCRTFYWLLKFGVVSCKTSAEIRIKYITILSTNMMYITEIRRIHLI
jgi:hypothetical protein